MKNKTKLARLLRKEQTEAEAKIWRHLRNRNLAGLKFRRQHPIKDYIVDFCCLEKQIIIELDGNQHFQWEQKEKDMLRDLHLRNLGFSILRFQNGIVFNNPEVIFSNILNAAAKKPDISFTITKHLQKNHPHPNLLPQRRRSVALLSTKKLASSQKELLLNTGHSLVEHDLISIVPLHFTLKNIPKNVIFTSKNAVNFVLSKYHNLSNHSIFCVGEKTAAFLSDNGVEVKETANYGLDLAKKIASQYSKEEFLFFCGRKRRPELPDYLKRKGISISEVEVYDTELVPKKIDRTFDGVLFFSPSAVRSFCAVNDLTESMAFCIGRTTASEAEKFTDQIKIATKPTVENVIVQVVKHFGKN